MLIKKYRFLLLIAVLFSSLNHCASIADHERKLINKLAKEALLLYAMQQNISPEDHLKVITARLFGTSNMALVILTKKIMRHVCKQLYLQGLPKLSLYAEALKKFQKYQRPAGTVKTTKQKKKHSHSLYEISAQFLKNHAGKITATCIVGLVLITLLASCQDLYEQMYQLRALIIAQDEYIKTLTKTKPKKAKAGKEPQPLQTGDGETEE